jgi:hypothetical protein
MKLKHAFRDFSYNGSSLFDVIPTKKEKSDHIKKTEVGKTDLEEPEEDQLSKASDVPTLKPTILGIHSGWGVSDILDFQQKILLMQAVPLRIQLPVASPANLRLAGLEQMGDQPHASSNSLRPVHGNNPRLRDPLQAGQHQLGSVYQRFHTLHESLVSGLIHY